jgi:hypothetical protein
MDKGTEREIRLQQLTQRLLAGDMTEDERQEYDALQEEQPAKLKETMLKLSAVEFDNQVKSRVRNFFRRKP